MKEYFSVNEMAKLNDINPRTLRYYDEIGLFSPSFCDENN
ncbi:MAG: MerR family DNA-binding transcriptional regulator, partial [Clostridiales bacterium]|nr:MerR family DNA-binding transcriptional regulator [Clostridiales bacterium]